MILAALFAENTILNATPHVCCVCRLELTVDQSWPPTVLASLGQLDRLKRLTVLKLDCGRQQPVEEMWEGERGREVFFASCAGGEVKAGVGVPCG
jgi:hypothetical protein